MCRTCSEKTLECFILKKLYTVNPSGPKHIKGSIDVGSTRGGTAMEREDKRRLRMYESGR